uniref:Peroxidase n=1 Tax=Caenorhabditis japonica TaxID=281687 RepID=A0A8R1IA96_CAEJA
MVSFLPICLIFFAVHRISAIEVTEESERIVEDAVMRALESLYNPDNLPQNNASSAGERIVMSQQANADSKSAQFTGEVLEEATRTLVQEFGMDILPVANEVINKWKVEEEQENDGNATEVPETRKKRQAVFRIKRQSGGSKKCTTHPSNCNDRFHTTTRSITGHCNNRENPELGKSVSPLRRVLGGAFYADGLGQMRTRSVTGAELPSARLISNVLHDDRNNQVFSANINHLHMIIGQFIAHDVVFIPSSVARNGGQLDCSACNSPQRVSGNCAPIRVSLNDRYFKIPCMRLTRALNGQENFGVRSQIGQNSHFLDLSTVYGSSECEMDSVRSFRDGKLKTFTGLGYTLPPQNFNDTNCQSKAPWVCFTCGDFRNSLHPALIPIHTIFIKEHNRLADLVRSRRRRMSDEEIFQLVRKILIGMWQHIVYNEYLPKYLPQRSLRNFDLQPLRNRVHLGYKPKQDPSISAEFAAAAFRFGHSQARFDFPRLNAAGRPAGNYDLGHDIFYADQNYLSGIGGWEPVMNGMVRLAGMKSDRYFSFGIRNQMFEIRGRNGSGVDLVSVNIQRGRDLGLHPYVMYRQFVGLSPVSKFNDLNTTFSKENINALRSVYSDPMDIDLYTGIMLEENMAGAQLGPTGVFLIAEQFKALKTGDRFFYESSVANTDNFNLDEMNEIRQNVTLAKLICTNMDSINRINTDIFDFRSNQVACSTLPEININTFLR